MSHPSLLAVGFCLAWSAGGSATVWLLLWWCVLEPSLKSLDSMISSFITCLLFMVKLVNSKKFHFHIKHPILFN
ncbi:hypothetical protein BVRB_3g051460 isoform B [Beta vulgaris subsp. vulgaris]|nr:hypothetical protein BVRB_3g051460 isoform B [Beta vulgaris subsp. vulgaris]